MSSGLEWSEDDDFDKAVPSRNAAKYAADKPLAHPPGTTFNYNTGSTFIIDRAMAMALGGGQAFTAFIRAELFTKLGINLTLSYDRYGTWLGGYAADGSTLEYAKFGLLYLRDGIWDGQRILPPGWVEYSRTPSRSNSRYGAGWWLDPEARLHSPAVPDQGSGPRPGAFFALGARGQVIGVDPPHDLVFVITATDSDISKPVSRAIMTAFTSS
jgi:CubicO group peptidase (beta-lactamase class C family)